MNQVYVIGIGLDGTAGLSPEARKQLEKATLITGSKTHLEQVEAYSAAKLPIDKNVETWLDRLEEIIKSESIVVLASGDPLFFGIGRLLIERFKREDLRFYPHLSSVQLAMARLCIPWQSATVVSVHGRMPDELEREVKKGASPLAVLTDGVYTPGAIAQLIQDLRPPVAYKLWVCSQLGSAEERVRECTLAEAASQTFSSPNVVVLEKIEQIQTQQPLFGIPDEAFCTFNDQPGLLTKQEIRVLSLSFLRLAPQITVWDIGAGTGSISIEIGRLVPDANIFAIEQKAAGVQLIRKNCDRFGVKNIEIIAGVAPAALVNLPSPDRIILGGGGNKLPEILAVCCQSLKPEGVIVANFATLEACAIANEIFRSQHWSVRMLQVNIARSVSLQATSPDAIDATRFVPLNPVTILQAFRS